MAKELKASEVLSKENLDPSQMPLTKTELEKMYRKGHEIVYFREDDEPLDKIAKQQAVLRLAKDTGGLVFTGIHSETDWSKTRWWDPGWHLANRTGEYAVVIDLSRLPPNVTGPASLKRYGKALYNVRRTKKAKTTSGLRGIQ